MLRDFSLHSDHCEYLRYLTCLHHIILALPTMCPSQSPEPYQPVDRRPLKSRGWQFSKVTTSALVRAGISANTISVFGMAYGIAAGVCLATTGMLMSYPNLPSRAMWLLAAIFIQKRLLANLLDGMVAIESGKASPVGELYNEI